MVEGKHCVCSATFHPFQKGLNCLILTYSTQVQPANLQPQGHSAGWGGQWPAGLFSHLSFSPRGCFCSSTHHKDQLNIWVVI